MCYEEKDMPLPVYTAEIPKISWIHMIQTSFFILRNLADSRGKYCIFCIVMEGMSSEACSSGIIGLEKYRVLQDLHSTPMSVFEKCRDFTHNSYLSRDIIMQP
jgi:hypothetical protein